MPVPEPYIARTRELLAEMGITVPEFPQLVPNTAPVNVALLQPNGDIADAATGVRNSNSAVAATKLRLFLQTSVEAPARLAVTPEYCCPWQVIDEIVEGQIALPQNAIWVLGCEATSIADLRHREANTGAGVVWLFEAPEPHQDAGQSFLDPVCIIFHASRTSNGDGVVVVVVQFKTSPMGGTAYEQDGLIRGARIYELRNANEYSIRLLVLLCSDVIQYPGPRFANLETYFSEPHRILLFHLQLNAEPRHNLYRPYRQLFLRRYEGREVIT